MCFAPFSLHAIEQAVDETDDGIEGPNDREKACGEQRVAAARAWKQFKKAERALRKVCVAGGLWSNPRWYVPVLLAAWGLRWSEAGS